MRHRPFGRTGIEVSELVFGGGWVGGILIHQDDATKVKALRRAMDGGINFIDTAPSYGAGKSEEALGWLLKEVDQRPYLATKVRLDPAKLDDIAGQVQASIEQSLSRLKRDRVDLLQLHNPIRAGYMDDAVTLKDVLGPGGAIEALEAVRAAGVTDHIGFTALGEADLCRQVIESGRVASAQVYYNLLNPSAGRSMPAAWSGQDFGRLLQSCRTHGVAAMNIRVLAAGVIATDERHGRENQIAEGAELDQETARAKAAFDRLGERHGTRAQTALRFSLANPDLACIVVGMAELDHLEQALGAADRGPLPEDALAELDRLYASNFDL